MYFEKLNATSSPPQDLLDRSRFPGHASDRTGGPSMSSQQSCRLSPFPELPSVLQPAAREPGGCPANLGSSMNVRRLSNSDHTYITSGLL